MLVIQPNNMKEKLIPTNFKIPQILETNKFRLRMLTIKDVKLDYDAVMTSIKHLQETKPFGPKHNWPTKELIHQERE